MNGGIVLSLYQERVAKWEPSFGQQKIQKYKNIAINVAIIDIFILKYYVVTW